MTLNFERRPFNYSIFRMKIRSIDHRVERLKIQILDGLKKKGILNDLQARFLCNVSEFIQTTNFDVFKPHKDPRRTPAYEIAESIVIQYLQKKNMKNSLKSTKNELNGKISNNQDTAKKIKVNESSLWIHQIVSEWNKNKKEILKQNRNQRRKLLSQRLKDIEEGNSIPKVEKMKKEKPEMNQKEESLKVNNEKDLQSASSASYADDSASIKDENSIEKQTVNNTKSTTSVSTLDKSSDGSLDLSADPNSKQEADNGVNKRPLNDKAKNQVIQTQNLKEDILNHEANMSPNKAKKPKIGKAIWIENDIDDFNDNDSGFLSDENEPTLSGSTSKANSPTPKSVFNYSNFANTPKKTEEINESSSEKSLSKNDDGYYSAEEAPEVKNNDNKKTPSLSSEDDIDKFPLPQNNINKPAKVTTDNAKQVDPNEQKDMMKTSNSEEFEYSSPRRKETSEEFEMSSPKIKDTSEEFEMSSAKQKDSSEEFEKSGPNTKKSSEEFEKSGSSSHKKGSTSEEFDFSDSPKPVINKKRKTNFSKELEISNEKNRKNNTKESTPSDVFDDDYDPNKKSLTEIDGFEDFDSFDEEIGKRPSSPIKPAPSYKGQTNPKRNKIQSTDSDFDDAFFEEPIPPVKKPLKPITRKESSSSLDFSSGSFGDNDKHPIKHNNNNKDLSSNFDMDFNDVDEEPPMSKSAKKKPNKKSS